MLFLLRCEVRETQTRTLVLIFQRCASQFLARKQPPADAFLPPCCTSHTAGNRGPSPTRSDAHAAAPAPAPPPAAAAADPPAAAASAAPAGAAGFLRQRPAAAVQRGGGGAADEAAAKEEMKRIRAE